MRSSLFHPPVKSPALSTELVQLGPHMNHFQLCVYKFNPIFSIFRGLGATILQQQDDESHLGTVQSLLRTQFQVQPGLVRPGPGFGRGGSARRPGAWLDPGQRRVRGGVRAAEKGGPDAARWVFDGNAQLS